MIFDAPYDTASRITITSSEALTSIQEVKMAPSNIDVTKTLGNNTNTKWWKDPGMRKLNFMILCVITAQMTCGYDEAVVGNFQAMKPWLKGMKIFT
jgi:hypothetical protein